MKRTAQEIRAHLKKLGYLSRLVSVRCKPSYQIIVKTMSPKIDNEKLYRDVLEVYHSRPHYWLIVWVNKHCLPMPPIKEE